MSSARISQDEVRAARELRRQLVLQQESDARREAAALRKVRNAARDARAKPALKVPANAWTEAEIAILRDVYPKAGAHRVATLLGRTFVGVGDKAHRLGLTGRRGKRPDGTARTDRIVDALRAAVSNGLSIDEIDVLARFSSRRTTVTTVSRMVVTGTIFASAMRQNRRYFSTQRQAQAWDAFLRPRTQREIREALKGGRDASTTPMQIHPDFKYTVAPPMPAVLRTNTYSMY